MPGPTLCPCLPPRTRLVRSHTHPSPHLSCPSPLGHPLPSAALPFQTLLSLGPAAVPLATLVPVLLLSFSLPHASSFFSRRHFISCGRWDVAALPPPGRGRGGWQCGHCRGATSRLSALLGTFALAAPSFIKRIFFKFYDRIGRKSTVL